jgi:3-hydroxyacyl-CoA dehydrogenase
MKPRIISPQLKGRANRNLRRSKETRIFSLTLKEHKEALIERITNSFMEKKAETQEKAAEFTESISEKMAKLSKLAKEYKEAKKNALVIPAAIKKLSLEIKTFIFKFIANIIIRHSSKKTFCRITPIIVFNEFFNRLTPTLMML